MCFRKRKHAREQVLPSMSLSTNRLQKFGCSSSDSLVSAHFRPSVFPRHLIPHFRVQETPVFLRCRFLICRSKAYDPVSTLTCPQQHGRHHGLPVRPAGDTTRKPPPLFEAILDELHRTIDARLLFDCHGGSFTEPLTNHVNMLIVCPRGVKVLAHCRWCVRKSCVVSHSPRAVQHMTNHRFSGVRKCSFDTSGLTRLVIQETPASSRLPSIDVVY